MVVPGLCVAKQHAADVPGLEIHQATGDVEGQLVEQLHGLVVHAAERPERIGDVHGLQEQEAAKQLGLGGAEEDLSGVVAELGYGPQAA